MVQRLARLDTTDRPFVAPHKELVARRACPTGAPAASVARREELFAEIRLSRSIGAVDIPAEGAVVRFPSFVVIDGQVHDLVLSMRPGLFGRGRHDVDATLTIDGLRIDGSFQICVGDGPAAAAHWTATSAETDPFTVDGPADVPADVRAQLPQSTCIAVAGAGALVGAVRRVHLAAEAARRELLESNRGLVRSVVNRFRALVRSESASLDLSDLMIVGEHHLLDVVDRWYTDPATAPHRGVAWSKLVQRAVGNAVRSEIARATGVSVEFRQLLAWFHAHPEDRSEPATLVAQRMAFAAGVTRLMAQRNLSDRTAGVASLELMLVDGTARYVPPSRTAADESKALRANGVFVISSRSSIAEIERAQRSVGDTVVRLDADTEQGHRLRPQLSVRDLGYDDTDATDLLRRVIALSGLTKIEALVWLHRTGALDPGGYGMELPDIAEDLGLNGRGEARAALRRARRKLDAWAVDGRLALVG